MEQLEFLRKAVTVLEGLHIRYLLCGSMASGVYGEPHMTRDIDVVADLHQKHLPELREAFPPDDYYMSLDAARDALLRRASPSRARRITCGGGRTAAMGVPDPLVLHAVFRGAIMPPMVRGAQCSAVARGVVMRSAGVRRLRAAGIMSGTSCDGVTTAVADVSRRGASLAARFVASGQTAYPASLRRRLLAAAALDVPSLAALHVELGRFWAECLCAHLRGAGIAAVELVGSHGHSLFHRPPGACRRRSDLPVSWQIGEAAEIAARVQCPVVADFRPADIAAGGEGAPLVPFADAVFFRPARGVRVCLNVGGIANITVLGPRGAPRCAFDTGPGVMLLDAAAAHASGGRLAMDRDGAMAARGRVDTALLERWLAHGFFSTPPPRSTGRELFGRPFLDRALRRNLSAEDLLATLTALTVESIARAVASLPARPRDMIVAGGGVRNPVLMARLRARLAPLPIDTSDALGWPSDAREAAAFALLAAAFVWRIPASFRTTTGVRQAALLGKLSLP